jgi:hypothetical protein
VLSRWRRRPPGRCAGRGAHRRRSSSGWTRARGAAGSPARDRRGSGVCPRHCNAALQPTVRSASGTGLRIAPTALSCWACMEVGLPCGATAYVLKSRIWKSKSWSTRSSSTPVNAARSRISWPVDDQREQVLDIQQEVQALLQCGYSGLGARQGLQPRLPGASLTRLPFSHGYIFQSRVYEGFVARRRHRISSVRRRMPSPPRFVPEMRSRG